MSDLQLRPSDLDFMGHINNSIYFDYIQQGFAAFISDIGYESDWLSKNEFHWLLRSISVENYESITWGDKIKISLWEEEQELQDPLLGAEISSTNSNEEIIHCRAYFTYDRIKTSNGKKIGFPPELLSQFPKKRGTPLKNFSFDTNSQVRKFELKHRVLISETGLNRESRLSSIIGWFHEAVEHATSAAGWPLKKRFEIGHLAVEIRHDVEVFSPPMLWNNINIYSKLISSKRFRGTWLHEIFDEHNKELLVKTYTHGFYVDLDGKPSTPPSSMISDIQGS